MLSLVPLKLYGDGEFNLNVAKEIKVTDSFLGLDMDTKQCEMSKQFENCTTEAYISKLLQQCGCLPFNIRTTEEV